MSEFQQRDQIEPNSSPAQPAEMVEFEGVVIDTATHGGGELQGSGSDLNKTIEHVRQQEQWLSAQQEVVEIEIELEEPLVRFMEQASAAEADADTAEPELNTNPAEAAGQPARQSQEVITNGTTADESIGDWFASDDSWLTTATEQRAPTNRERTGSPWRESQAEPIQASRLDDSSHELSELGRLEFGKADTAGKLLEAIQTSFDPSISAEAYQLAQQFISGNTAPEISWASFDSDLIQGAYISDSNTILLNQAIRQDTATVQQVLVEELGHWLDDQAHGINGGDSAGDEGRRLAQALLPEITNSSSASNDQVVMQLNDQLVIAELSYTRILNKPVRLDSGPRALVIIEDGTTTDLGLTGVEWVEQAELNRATGERQAIAPIQINQGLTIQVKGLPAPDLGQVLKADDTPLNLNDPLSIDELKNLKFSAIANAHGSDTFSYDVTNGNGDTSSESFSIKVLAVNDNPQSQGSEQFVQRVIKTEDLSVDGQGAYAAVSLNLQDTVNFNLSFGATDPNPDPDAAQLQTVSYAIEQLPPAAFGTLLLDGVAVQDGATLSLEEVKRLSLQAATDISSLEAAERVASIRLAVQDDGTTPTGGARSASLQITVAIAKPGGADLTTLMNIPGFNPSTDLTAEEIAQLSEGSMFQDTDKGTPQFLNPQLYAQVKKDNPLYLAEIGGTGAIDTEDINYSSLNVPFMFDIPMGSLKDTNYTNGGTEPTHELIYKPSLRGQFRDNTNGVYSLAAGTPAGFTLSADGQWKLDLDHADYKGWATGRQEILNINYNRSDTALSMSVELTMGEHAMVASASGDGAEQSTTNRGFWVKSNAEGREKDRYFKYINEFVLSSYGAQKVGTNEETGDGIFSWTGVAKTADGKPLTLLDGTEITQSGYYDFTRRDGAGDGVEFLYETVTENGKEVDYIVGMRYFISNNMYGDNDVSNTNIRDPGSGIAVMRELGVVTTGANGADTVVTIMDDSGSEASSRPVVNAESYDAFDSDAIDDSLDSAIQTALQQQGSASEGSRGELQTADIGSEQDSSDGRLFQGDTGSGDTSELTLSAAIGPFQEEAVEDPSLEEDEDGEGEGEKKGSGADPLGENDGDGDQVRKRGLRFTSAAGTSAETTSKPMGLLESLANVDLLGTNLLDGLAIGLGLLYLLYGPGQIRSTQKPIRQWIGGVTGKSSRHALALFWISADGGNDQLVAAEIRQTRLQLVAQAELASQNGPQPLEQSIGQILSELKSHRGGTLLLDPRLLTVVEQDPAILKQFKNYSRSPLEPSAYSGVLAGMDPAQLQAIRSWLASPQLENADTELLELLKTRAQSFEDRLDRERATIATSIELSLALALLSS